MRLKEDKPYAVKEDTKYHILFHSHEILRTDKSIETDAHWWLLGSGENRDGE